MSDNRHIPHWQEAGVVSTFASPFAPLKPVPVQAVTMREGFWKTRMHANRTNGIPAFLAWLDVDDQTAPFRAYAAGDKAGIAAGLETLRTNPTGMNRTRNGHSWRANFHKWLEACAYVMQSGDDPDTRALLDLLVTGVANAHQDSVIEMALVELYRTTGKERYLAGARHFLTPLLRQPPIIGSDFLGYLSRHVVRQTYLMCGGADYYAETGDQVFMDKLTAIWRDMTAGKLHLTGQLAVDSENCELTCKEAFELHAGVFRFLLGTGLETCEAIGNATWNWRMLAVTGDACYADLMERTLYNGFLVHVSADGGKFHYMCPLSSDGNHWQRTPWSSASTSCCSPNALRTIASLPGYMFSTSQDGVWIHLYDSCTMDWRLDDGTKLCLAQDASYPWEGNVTITLDPERPSTFDLNLRIPEWCRNPTVQMNGQPVEGDVAPGTYCRITREWRKGDSVTLQLPMHVVAVTADPRARYFEGKVALCRGPLVYCAESTDNPAIDMWGPYVALPPGNGEDDGRELLGHYRQSALLSEFGADFRQDLLGGVVALQGDGGSYDQPDAGLTFIPYYAWANRDSRSSMRTWMDGKTE